MRSEQHFSRTRTAFFHRKKGTFENLGGGAFQEGLIRFQEGLIPIFSLDKQTAHVKTRHFVYFPRIMLICQEQTHVQWTKMYDYSAAERDSHSYILILRQLDVPHQV